MLFLSQRIKFKKPLIKTLFFRAKSHILIKIKIRIWLLFLFFRKKNYLFVDRKKMYFTILKKQAIVLSLHLNSKQLFIFLYFIYKKNF